MGSRIRVVLVVALMLVGPDGALPWGNLTAHPAINDLAEDLFLVRACNKGYGGKYVDAGIDMEFPKFSGMTYTNGGLADMTSGESVVSLPLYAWIERGGFDADEPEFYQSKRHFYDPVFTPRHLTDQLGDSTVFNPRIDAKTWALEHPDHRYSWKKALAFYKAGMENDLTTYGAQAKSREALFAAAFRALGETMHMVGDMACVPHVRNDSHPYTDPLEDSTPGTLVKELVGESCDTLAGPPVPGGVLAPGMTPGEIMEALASFTNRRFFSEDTVADAATGVKPVNGEKPYPGPQLSDLTKRGTVYVASIGGRDVGLVEETLSHHIFSKPTRSYTVSSVQAREQASVLIPLAVAACADVIDAFFPHVKPKLETIPDPADPGKSLVRASLEFVPTTAWTRAGLSCTYSGPAAIVVAGSRAEVPFEMKDGVGTLPGDTFKAGDKLSLLVLAGARRFTTPPMTYEGGPGLLARLQKTRSCSAFLAGVFTFGRGGASELRKQQFNVPFYGKDRPRGFTPLTWSGAAFRAAHREVLFGVEYAYSVQGSVAEATKSVSGVFQTSFKTLATPERAEGDLNLVRFTVAGIPLQEGSDTRFSAHGPAFEGRMSVLEGRWAFMKNGLAFDILGIDPTGTAVSLSNEKLPPSLAITFH